MEEATIVKKSFALLFVALMAVIAVAGCTTAKTPDQTPPAFDTAKEIAVVSREEGSGTRGAFVELTGVQGSDKVDRTTLEAIISNGTSVVMTTVAGNDYAIGYISLGSVNATIKAVNVDGATPTVANINSGSYKLARPFNIATKGDLSDTAADFVSFILSAQGQEIVEGSGYIKSEGAPAYTASGMSGKVVLAGSSSVTPLMEKLREAYLALNPDATIEVQMSDSSAGMTAALEGLCDIGMASRELKESELSAGLTPTVIAMDGIAVIVNLDNPIANLTSEQIAKIFTGEFTQWSDVLK
jgi:phosphate transport system substrate-binding protein